MLNVTIICVGKLKESYLRDACAEYIKRLGAFCRLNIAELSPARLPEEPNPSQIAAALADEEKRILAAVPKGSVICSLCIEGRELSSPELASMLEGVSLSGAGGIAFIIGGSHGLSDTVKSRSDSRLSMSRMTFPHQLARVLLLEQIYRAFMISSGGKYHK